MKGHVRVPLLRRFDSAVLLDQQGRGDLKTLLSGGRSAVAHRQKSKPEQTAICESF
jgi:hypothetical protein